MRARPGALRASEQTLGKGQPPTWHPGAIPLAAAAEAVLTDLDGVPDSAPGLARPSHPANPAERRDTIAQAWQDEPGITDAALAERFGVSRRTIQRDTQALQERGIQRRRRRNSHRTQAHYAAIYRRFFAWLADEFGRPATRQDLSADVLARWIARPASAGGHGGGKLSSASLRLECTALRQLVRRAGRPSWPPGCMPPGSRHPRRRPSHPPSTSGCSLSLT
jgi:biotin operon repressor